MNGNDGISVIQDYFPGLTSTQLEKYSRMYALYVHWNEKINVISRKDLENLYVRHILHSLFISKFIQFHPGTSVLDLGTGGGFPGIPLAIQFPEVNFHLIDARAKKIMVVSEVSQALELGNISSEHTRVEDLKRKFDFVVSRAVAPLPKLVDWSRPRIKGKHMNAIPNGLICLKGGDVKTELKSLGKSAYSEVEPISQWSDHPYFAEKCIIYVQL